MHSDDQDLVKGCPALAVCFGDRPIGRGKRLTTLVLCFQVDLVLLQATLFNPVRLNADRLGLLGLRRTLQTFYLGTVY